MKKKHAQESVHSNINPGITASLPYIKDAAEIKAAISAIKNIKYDGLSGQTYLPSIGSSRLVAAEFESEAQIGKWIDTNLPGFHGSSVNVRSLMETSPFENALGVNGISSFDHVTSNRIGIYEHSVGDTGSLSGFSIAQSQFYGKGVGMDICIGQSSVLQPDATRLGANSASSQIHRTLDCQVPIPKHAAFQLCDSSASSLIHGIYDGYAPVLKANSYWPDSALVAARIKKTMSFDSFVTQESPLELFQTAGITSALGLWDHANINSPSSPFGLEQNHSKLRLPTLPEHYLGNHLPVLYEDKERTELAQEITKQLGQFLEKRTAEVTGTSITFQCHGNTINIALTYVYQINASNIRGEIVQIGGNNIIKW